MFILVVNNVQHHIQASTDMPQARGGDFRNLTTEAKIIRHPAGK